MPSAPIPSSPSPHFQILKAPIGTYEFGANVISEKFMMLGRIATDGRLSGRLKYDVLDWLGVKLHMQLSNEAGQSQARIWEGEGVKVQSQANSGKVGGNMAWQ